jgi:hypothetical protein
MVACGFLRCELGAFNDFVYQTICSTSLNVKRTYNHVSATRGPKEQVALLKNIDNFKVSDLKAELKLRDMDTTGKKEVLAMRLRLGGRL